MPKEIKTNNKNVPNKKSKEDFDEVEGVVETHPVEEEEEILPEDIKDALGINRAEKAAKIKEVDYISELENGDEFGLDETPSKSSFDDDFDDMD